MTFTIIEEIEKTGFMGFRKMSKLFDDSSIIPRTKGVYFVLYVDKKSLDYLPVGTGGHFKSNNPNVPIAQLMENWVDDTILLAEQHHPFLHQMAPFPPKIHS